MRREKKEMQKREQRGLIGAPIGLHELVYYDPEKSPMKVKSKQRHSSVASSMSFASSGSRDRFFKNSILQVYVH